MKKVQKIIGISFFGLFAFAFLMLAIGDLVGIKVFFECFSAFKETWGLMIAYVLELVLCIILLIKVIITLIGMAKGKETDAKALAKKSCKNISLYFLLSSIGQMMILIMYLIDVKGFDSEFILPIVLILLNIAGAVIASIASKQDDGLKIKILGSVAYGLLLVTSIFGLASGYAKMVLVSWTFSTAGTGSTAIFTICGVFMILTAVLAIVHLVMHDMAAERNEDK